MNGSRPNMSESLIFPLSKSPFDINMIYGFEEGRANLGYKVDEKPFGYVISVKFKGIDRVS